MSAMPPAPPAEAHAAPAPRDPVKVDEKKVWSWTSLGLLVLNVLGLWLLWPAFAFLTPRFLEVFADRGRPLPTLTHGVKWLADRSILLGILCLLLSAGLVAAHFLSRHKAVSVMLNIAVGVGVGLFLAVWMLALFQAVALMFD
jgi:hypothetical protein